MEDLTGMGDARPSIDERDQMNSSDLQQRFQGVYKSFFNAHDIVLSAPGILTWGADISHGISALRIKQKLPLSTFCGAQFNTTGEVTFGKVFHYSLLENVFKEDGFNVFFKYDTEKLSRFLKDFLVQHDISLGIDIAFLSEAPRGHGFAFTGVISVLLTFLLHLVIESFDTATLSSRELSRVEADLFEELYLLSLELSNCISGGKSIGNANNYAIMLPGNTLPIVHLSRTSGSDHTSEDSLIRKDTLQDFLGMDSAGVHELPLDYGVIFTGAEYTFSDTESMRERAKKENKRLDAFLEGTFAPLLSRSEDRISFSHILSFHKDQASSHYIENTNLRMLEGFDHLFKNIHEDGALSIFIDIIKNIGLISFSCQKENKLFFALKYFFSKHKQFDDEEIGIIPFNTGKIGGSLLFVMKQGKSRETMQKVLTSLRSDGHIAFLDYASYRDGYSDAGVRLDQHLSKEAYSLYTQEGNTRFSDTWGRSYCGDYEKIIEDEKESILLDTIQGRIYINGVKLTSKDIHSQNTTIDMFRILMEHIGQDIPNTDLPVSTYSQNKSEILNKVVLPIRKLAKEHFGQEIPLFCSGGIGNYYLRLERDESVRIGIIKKLGS